MFFPLMVVNDLHVGGVTVLPRETYAPLIIDSDAPLAFAITLQLLEMVCGRYAKVSQQHRGVKHK